MVRPKPLSEPVSQKFHRPFARALALSCSRISTIRLVGLKRSPSRPISASYASSSGMISSRTIARTAAMSGRTLSVTPSSTFFSLTNVSARYGAETPPAASGPSLFPAPSRNRLQAAFFPILQASRRKKRSGRGDKGRRLQSPYTFSHLRRTGRNWLSVICMTARRSGRTAPASCPSGKFPFISFYEFELFQRLAVRTLVAHASSAPTASHQANWKQRSCAGMVVRQDRLIPNRHRARSRDRSDSHSLRRARFR